MENGSSLAVHDRTIRTAFRRELIQQFSGDPSTLILSEFGLSHGTTRVDLIVVNGLLHGFELKGDLDTLERLPEQARIYSEVLDQATLIVGHKHFRSALQLIPRWWGVTLASAIDDTVLFRPVRKPRSNPSRNALSIAKLLWRAEALALLEQYRQADGVRSKPRAKLYERLAAVLSLPRLRKHVRDVLRSRTDWRADGLRTSSGG
jgi:hypothetical protein